MVKTQKQRIEKFKIPPTHSIGKYILTFTAHNIILNWLMVNLMRTENL
jgi:hypothetical protein